MAKPIICIAPVRVRPQQHTEASGSRHTCVRYDINDHAQSRTWGEDTDTGQYHRPLILGGFAPERTHRRVSESDRSVGISLT